MMQVSEELSSVETYFYFHYFITVIFVSEELSSVETSFLKNIDNTIVKFVSEELSSVETTNMV